MNTLISSTEAARRLGVSRSTLYAYVSRDIIKPVAGTTSRTSQYRVSDIERLLRHRSNGRGANNALKQALDWGNPVLSSALSLVQDQRLYYRGKSALELAETHSLEAVASILWAAPDKELFDACAPTTDAEWLARIKSSRQLNMFERMISRFSPAQVLPLPPALAANRLSQAVRLLRLMTAAAIGKTPSKLPVHRQLQRAWRLPVADADVLRRALVLCADHELNPSNFSARCAASAGADLGNVVLVGLATLSGQRHGGITESVEDIWRRAEQSTSLTAFIRQENTSGRQIAGFHHPLYPSGDPRAVNLIRALPPDRFRTRLLAAVQREFVERPSIDFSLVAMRRALGLPRGAASAIFAIGRTVGWLAHAFEQQDSGQLIRPRAHYVGVPPNTECDSAESSNGTIHRIR